MKTKFFNLYQYIAFFIIFPLAGMLWYNNFANTKYALLAMSLPIITAYIIPAIGTNITKLWEFNNKKLMMGNFRIYHGFVLGSATSLFGFVLYKIPTEDFNGAILLAFIFGLFISIINFIYDAYAIKSGFIIIYNKPAYENKNAFLIAGDYALIYFFLFGFTYGIYIELLKSYYNNLITFNIITIILLHMTSLILPVGIYAVISKIKNKTWGICKYLPKDKKI